MGAKVAPLYVPKLGNVLANEVDEAVVGGEGFEINAGELYG